MPAPAAKRADRIEGVDVHIVQIDPTTQAPLPHPFSGAIAGGLSADVMIMGEPAATVGSTARNQPAHQPASPGGAFVSPPTNRATISSGSATVLINGKPAARAGDRAVTCNDPVPAPTGTVVAQGTVIVG